MIKNDFKDIRVIIGKRIKEARLNMNLTQEELAEKVNIDPKFVSHLERGVGFPSLETFIKIAEALKVSMDSLITDDKNNKFKYKKEDNKNLAKMQALFLTLTDKQQKYFIKTIKEFKSSVK